MKVHRILAAMLALAGASCVSRQAASADWPAAVRLRSLSQLGGVYHNEGEGGGAYGRSLYDFLSGELGTSNAKGERTELRPSADGKSIQVLLRDRRGKILESSLLSEKDGFAAKNGGLSLKMPAGLGESGVTNLGAFAGNASIVLMPAEGGGLLGKQSETSVGLFGFMIPFAASGQENYYWPLDRVVKRGGEIR